MERKNAEGVKAETVATPAAIETRLNFMVFVFVVDKICRRKKIFVPSDEVKGHEHTTRTGVSCRFVPCATNQTSSWNSAADWIPHIKDLRKVPIRM